MCKKYDAIRGMTQCFVGSQVELNYIVYFEKFTFLKILAFLIQLPVKVVVLTSSYDFRRENVLSANMFIYQAFNDHLLYTKHKLGV